MITNLQGQFQIDKSDLIKEDLNLVIGTRKKLSANKPLHFLLKKDGGKFTYLSSLYPFNQDAIERAQDDQIFSFDWQGEYFLLSLNRAENKAEIRRMETGGKQAPGATKPGQGGGMISKSI